MSAPSVVCYPCGDPQIDGARAFTIRQRTQCFIMEPWPQIVPIDRRTLDGLFPRLASPSIIERDGDIVTFRVDNGHATYRKIAEGEFTWFGELVESTYQPAPPEPAPAAS